MFSSELKNWPIFTVVQAEFISKIRMAVVYDNLGHKALVVTNDEMVYALGTTANRHYENGDICNTLGSFKVEKLCGKGIKTFAFGKNYILALTKQGQVYTSRCNYGTECCVVPTFMECKLGNNTVDIASGSYHFVTLTNDGQAYSWEFESNFESVRTELYTCPPITFTSIACGENFSVMITDRGEVFAAGRNCYGQLGIGNTASNRYPCKVKLDGIVIEKVVCGSLHTLALSTTGDLYVWGKNNSGQLGNGPVRRVTSIHVPIQLSFFKMGRVFDIAASYSHDISIAVTEKERKIFIWGSCLGQNITEPTYTSLKCVNEIFAYYGPSCTTYEPLIFHSDDEEQNFMDCFSNAFNDPTTSDLVMKVQGKPIYVHKAILKIRCPFLKTKFEECWDKHNEGVIEVEEYSNDVYTAFLQYLYTNEINLPMKDIIELYSLASTYSEDGLKDLCMFTLKKGITVRNAIFLYNKAIKHKATEIEKYCSSFAWNHLTLIIQSQDLAELDACVFKTLVLQAVQTDTFP